MLKYMEIAFLTAALTLLGFTSAAHASALVDPGGGTPSVDAVYAALSGGHRAYAAALALVALVALVRKFGGERWPALHTDLGSAALTLAGSFGAASVAALAGGGPMTWAVATGSFGVAFVAMGGYSAVNALVVKPYVVPWAATAPAWVQPGLKLVLFWFVHASDPVKT